MGLDAHCVVTRYCRELAIMSALLFDSFSSFGFARSSGGCFGIHNPAEQWTQFQPSPIAAPLLFPEIDTVSSEPLTPACGVHGYLLHIQGTVEVFLSHSVASAPVKRHAPQSYPRLTTFCLALSPSFKVVGIQTFKTKQNKTKQG